MKRIILLTFLLLAFGQSSLAFDSRYVLFKTQFGDETLEGYLEGGCGRILEVYKWKDSLLDVEDTNGMRRKFVVGKIKEIEISATKNSKPNVTVHLPEKAVSGKFYCGSVNLITETEVFDLNGIKNGSIKLTRSKSSD